MPLYSLDGRRPALPPEGRYWIAPSACLIGDVSVGIDCRNLVRGGLKGRQRGNCRWRAHEHSGIVHAHTDMGYPLIIGDDCTIGHNAILHGCAIGEGSLVGMGAVVLNGAKIGLGCLVGARALVTEGKEFADHSLIIGSPAKAVRTLDRAAIEGLRRSARQYVENWRRFAAGLKPIGGGAAGPRARRSAIRS